MTAAPDPIRAALLAATESAFDADGNDGTYLDIAAAAVAAFLRAFTGPNRMVMFSGQEVPDTLIPWLADQVDRAARKGKA